ncbi:helix-hairpin-helix domain-containing protein [Effusibacillus lacus]|uniref:Pathogenicity locus n=1 Tax=Effusibacillus lacus TaxID=1348429 RepID=A0A292YGY3_9BACL|nr:helix-hairpin-helix domain-containing protein [Effusibacillus lacus]GAX88758.1 pathogenicity locus [Effusibacillus lacus]
MKTKTPKLPLTPEEWGNLKRNRITLAQIADLEPEELARILQVSINRGKTLHALAVFQQIPSIGPRFAEDVVGLGYYSLEELQGSDGAKLFDQLEQQCGGWIDPCVEDQFRLLVHFANNPESDKSWWDFTEARKEYRMQHGYPENRPKTAWNDPARQEKQT